MVERPPSASSLSEPSFIFHPLSAPLATANPSPSPSSGYQPENIDFMFVEFQVGSREKAFIVKKFHRRRKQASVDRLKVRPLLTTRFSSRDERQDQGAAVGGGGNAMNRQMLIQASCEKRSLSTYPSKGYDDPFSPYGKPVAARLNMYLHHFGDHIIFASYPFHAPEMQLWWMQHASTSPAMLQTCAFRAAEHRAILQSSQGVSPEVVERSNRDSIGFRIMALKTLNALLRDPVTAATQSTVLLISSLVANEAFSANFQALQTHLEGLLTLISLLGGLDALDHMLLSTVYQGFLIIAALQNTRPLLPMFRKFRRAIIHEPKIFGTEEIDYDSEIPALLDPQTLGRGFATAPWREQLHPVMIGHLEAFRRLIRHFELANRFPRAGIVAPTDNDLFVVLQHDLLSTHFDQDRAAANGPGLNEPLRLTLIIYLFTRVCDFQNLPMTQVMLETLRQCLDAEPTMDTETLPPRQPLTFLTQTAPDLLFWILVIGGMASQGYSSHAWFVHHLAVVARDLGLEEWMGDVRPLLGEFFYTDRISQGGQAETAGENLWSEVVVYLRAGAYRHIAPRPGGGRSILLDSQID
ncbi:hypothetical protein BJX65DRAFT_309151 [Aspergillus insuetus]